MKKTYSRTDHIDMAKRVAEELANATGLQFLDGHFTMNGYEANLRDRLSGVTYTVVIDILPTVNQTGY